MTDRTGLSNPWAAEVVLDTWLEKHLPTMRVQRLQTPRLVDFNPTLFTASLINKLVRRGNFPHIMVVSQDPDAADFVRSLYNERVKVEKRPGTPDSLMYAGFDLAILNRALPTDDTCEAIHNVVSRARSALFILENNGLETFRGQLTSSPRPFVKAEQVQEALAQMDLDGREFVSDRLEFRVDLSFCLDPDHQYGHQLLETILERPYAEIPADVLAHTRSKIRELHGDATRIPASLEIIRVA